MLKQLHFLFFLLLGYACLQAQNPYMVADIAATVDYSTSANPSNIVAIGSTTYCKTSTPNAVWKTDGTAAGTVQISTVQMSSPWDLTNVNETLYFSAYTPGQTAAASAAYAKQCRFRDRNASHKGCTNRYSKNEKRRIAPHNFCGGSTKNNRSLIVLLPFNS